MAKKMRWCGPSSLLHARPQTSRGTSAGEIVAKSKWEQQSDICTVLQAPSVVQACLRHPSRNQRRHKSPPSSPWCCRRPTSLRREKRGDGGILGGRKADPLLRRKFIRKDQNLTARPIMCIFSPVSLIFNLFSLPSSLFNLVLNSIFASTPFLSYLKKGAAMPTDYTMVGTIECVVIWEVRETKQEWLRKLGSVVKPQNSCGKEFVQ